MKIALDASSLMRPLSGVGHYTASLMSSLLSSPEEHLLSLWAVTMSKDRSLIPAHPRVTFKHVHVPARWAVRIWEGLGAPDSRVLAGSCDVIHGTNFWVPPGTTPSVVTIHDLTFLLFPELCTPQVRRYRAIVPRVLDRCTAVITPSETVRLQVHSELGYPLEKIVVTPEGVRGTFVDSIPDPGLARKLGLPSNYLVFVGTLEPRKNLKRLIQAFKAVAPLHESLGLVLIGGEGWGDLKLRQVVDESGLGGRVFFAGYVEDRQLASLVVGARAFVFPTLYEGFGLPPLEAMAAGVPVVAARAGSLPEVLGDAPIYCDPLDARSIAEAIDLVLTDDAARQRAIEQGKLVAQRYSWARTTAATEGAYRLAMGAVSNER